MNLSTLIGQLKAHGQVLVKNIAIVDSISDVLSYYVECEPNSQFTTEYISTVGRDFHLQKAIELYLSTVNNISCTVDTNRFYTKIRLNES